MSELNTAATNIYNRLAAAPTFHPAGADLFTDWNVQSGDVINVASGEENYSVPIYNMRMKWTGSPKVEIESTGNPEREPLPAIKRREYSANSSTYSGMKSLGGGLGQALQQTEQIGNTLYEAGLVIDPQTGVWLYASEHGEDYALGATFKVQSDAITAEVSRATAAEGQAASRIQQTADAITAEVTRATNSESSLSSRLTITADQISTEVTNRQNADNALSSRITQNANSISLVVSNGSVNAASIISAINGGGSSVTISADKVDLQGYVKADQLQTEIARIDLLRAQAIETPRLTVGSSGAIIASAAIGTLTIEGGANVANAVASFQQATSSGGRINIPYRTLGGGTGTITFNIADTQFYRDGVAAARPHSLSSVTLSSSDTGSAVSKEVTVFCIDDEEYDLALTINASAVYTAGKNAMGVSANARTQEVSAVASSTKSVVISATVGTPSYNSNTHGYTVTGYAYAGSTLMDSDSVFSGTDAYDTGVTKGHSDRNIKASAFTVGNISDYPSLGMVTFNITATADDGTTYTSAYQSISYSGGGTYTLVNYARKNLTRYGYVQMYVYERNTYYSAGTHYWYWSSSDGWDTLYEQS